MAHVILFSGTNFQGTHIHAFAAVENLNDSHDEAEFNDRANSFYILDGYWQFFKDWLWETPFPLGSSTPVTLGPGGYPDIGAALGSYSNSAITSLRPVEPRRGKWELAKLTAPKQAQPLRAK